MLRRKSDVIRQVSELANLQSAISGHPIDRSEDVPPAEICQLSGKIVQRARTDPFNHFEHGPLDQSVNGFHRVALSSVSACITPIIRRESW